MKVKILFILLTLTVGCLFTHCDSNTQRDKKSKSIQRPQQLTITNPKVITSIEDYIKNDVEHNGEMPKVYQVFIEEYYDTIIYKITSIIYYSSLVERIPLAYTMLEGKIIVFYAGIELMAKPDSSFYEELRVVIGNNLQNNLLEDNKTLNPDFLPSTYDPLTWKVAIHGDSVAIDKNSLAPDLIRVPIKEIKKFVPPK